MEDREQPAEALRYECMLCGTSVLRDGDECFDCRKRRPEALRRAMTGERSVSRRRRAAQVGGAVTAIAAAAFVAGLTDFGEPGEQWRASVHAEINAILPITGNCVVVGTEDDGVLALDEASGAQRWQLPLDAAVRSIHRAADRACVRTDDQLISLELRTGAREWQVEIASNGVMASEPRRLLLTTAEGVFAHDPRTGEELWSYYVDDDRTARGVTVRGKVAWFGYEEELRGEEPATAVRTGGVACLDLESRLLRWETDLGAAVAHGPMIAGGNVVAVTENGWCYAINPNDGKVGWRQDRISSLPAQSGSHLVMVRGGGVVAIDAITGEVQWTNDALTGVRSVHSLDEGTVFALTGDALCALRSRSGRERYRRELPSAIAAELDVAGGAALVASSHGTLHAYDIR